MKAIIKRLIFYFTPGWIKRTIISLELADSKRIYAQEAEDLLVYLHSKYQKSGFYLDIGANHPKRYSSTYLLYKIGWRGVVVEPNIEFLKDFDEFRPEDTFINAGLGKMSRQQEYYKFSDPALNTFDYNRYSKLLMEGNFRFYHSIVIDVITVSELKSKVKFPDKIDLINIDIEGRELDVLEDILKYLPNPKFFLIEDIFGSISEVIQFSQIHRIMLANNYKFLARTYNTSLYSSNNV